MLSEQDLEEMGEHLGAAGHEAWRLKRASEKGWHSPEQCDTLKKTGKRCPNCHDCMRPYDQLSDSEKELPRAYPTIFLAVLEDMGYTIVKK